MIIQSKGLIVLDYIRQYPDYPHRSLAKIIYNKYPDIFDSVDATRTLVRQYKGSLGPEHRKWTDKLYPEFKGRRDGMTHMQPIPPSKSNKWEFANYQYKKTLVLSDVHVPFHDVKGLEAALAHGDKYKPDCILLNGDILDCYALSRFIRDPRLRNFPDECQALSEFFAHLKERFKKAQIVWKFGNHEERYEYLLFRKVPDIVNTNEWELEYRIPRFKEYNIEVIKNKRIIKLGKLPIIHGHEFMRSPMNPVNAARGLFLRGVHSAIISHFHHTSEHVQPNLLGKIITCWSTGCLSGLHPEWATINRWNHGFTTVDLDGYSFSVANYRIYEGKIL